jgi:hypothetical protein
MDTFPSTDSFPFYVASPRVRTHTHLYYTAFRRLRDLAEHLVVKDLQDVNSRSSHWISLPWVLVLDWQRNTSMLHSHSLNWYGRKGSEHGADTNVQKVSGGFGSFPSQVLLQDTKAQSTTAALHYTSHQQMFLLNVVWLLLGYDVDVNVRSNAGLWLYAGLGACSWFGITGEAGYLSMK